MTSYVRQVGGRTTSIVNKAYRGRDRGRTISIAAQLRQTLVNSPPGFHAVIVFSERELASASWRSGSSVSSCRNPIVDEVRMRMIYPGLESVLLYVSVL